jgi:hypothetical protein
MTSDPAVRALTAGDAPKLFFWGARTLFLGKALGLSAHRNAVAVLCAGVNAPFEIACDPKRPEVGYLACRTALIPANTLHHLRCRDSPMAFLYVDARSGRETARMLGPRRGLRSRRQLSRRLNVDHTPWNCSFASRA